MKSEKSSEMAKSAIRFGLENYPEPDQPYQNSALRPRRGLRKDPSKNTLKRVSSDILGVSFNGKSSANVSKDLIEGATPSGLLKLDKEELLKNAGLSKPEHMTRQMLSDDTGSLGN